MIVEVVTGADERPEARVVDIDDLSRVVLALGQVTDEEAAEVLQRSGLGRMQDAGTAQLDAAALRAAARAAGHRRRLDGAVGRDGAPGPERGPAVRRRRQPSACTWSRPPER